MARVGEKESKSAFAEALEVEKLNVGFPVYAVEYCPESNVLFVAGGGGPAKSGVRNSIVSKRLLERGEVGGSVSTCSFSPRRLAPARVRITLII